MSKSITEEKQLVIVGGGPAGLAAGIQASDLLGIVPEIIEPGQIGAGGLRKIEDQTRSNTPGWQFADPYKSVFTQALELPDAKPIADVDEPVPLTLPSRFLDAVGHEVTRQGIVHQTRKKVRCLRHTPNGWEIYAGRRRFLSEKVILSPGAKEVLLSELADRDPNVTFTSKDVLSHKRAQDFRSGLGKHPRVVIVGGSHGAYSVALKILEQYPGVSVDLYKIEDTKVYFKNIQEALEHGYIPRRTEIDPLTEQVNRFDGIRGEARQLFFEEQEGKHARHLRSSVFSVEEISDALRSIDPEVIVVQAIGYKPRKLDIRDENWSPIDYTERIEPGGYSCLYGADNKPLPNINSLGLGHSACDGTNVYHTQARELLIVGSR